MEKESHQKSYYAVIPANVRYDRNISANEKLLFGEITALSNERGYCFASNGYFAELYGVAKETVSKWVRSLQKAGHIVTFEHITQHGSQRRIKLTPLNENVNPHCEKDQPPLTKTLTPLNEKVNHNNTTNNKDNNTYNKEGKEKKKPVKKEKITFFPPTLLEVESYFIENGFSKEIAKRAFNFYNIADWHDANGKKVKNWKQKMQGVWFKEENNTKEKSFVKKENNGITGEYQEKKPDSLF